MGQPTETIRTTALATTVSAATADAARRCIDLQEGGIVVDPTVPDPKRSRNLWRENGCTPACAETVPCPVCGNALPPCGRSVAPEVCLPDCCETHRYDLANTRHLWSADELDD